MPIKHFISVTAGWLNVVFWVGQHRLQLLSLFYCPAPWKVCVCGYNSVTCIYTYLKLVMVITESHPQHTLWVLQDGSCSVLIRWSESRPTLEAQMITLFTWALYWSCREAEPEGWTPLLKLAEEAWKNC